MKDMMENVDILALVQDTLPEDALPAEAGVFHDPAAGGIAQVVLRLLERLQHGALPAGKIGADQRAFGGGDPEEHPAVASRTRIPAAATILFQFNKISRITETSP